MTRRAGVAAAIGVAALLALTSPAAAELRLDGHGFGHGVGLSQWGAYGYAKEGGRDFRFILDHYYPGTGLRKVEGARVRVLLKSAGSAKVCSVTRARDARGRSVDLRPERSYRASPWRGDGLSFLDVKTGRVRAHLHAPVRVTGGASTCLRGLGLNERRDRSYRGALVLLRDGEKVPVVNDVAMRHYLYGVVPAEMPASWPAAALQAQAVAARSYALRALKPSAPFDVLPNQSSQVYGGIEEETATTTAAVRRTDPLVVFSGGSVAATYFSSSSGGTTAAVEEGFPGAEPASYLRAVDDPYDRLSPHHDWTVAFTDKAAQKKLGDAVEGDLESLSVTARTPTGRASTVRVTGSGGAVDVSAATIRARLGLQSVWFSVAENPEEPAVPSS